MVVYKRLLLILLLLTSTAYSQFDWFSNKGGVKYYAYTPVNIGAVASYDQIILTGGSTRITSDEISGTKIAYQRWMRWWTDTEPIDSVNGYAKLLTGITEDIPYYYSQSGRYITATDTVYAYAETDTIYSIIYPPHNTSVDAIVGGIAVTWTNGSNAEIGYEVSYAKHESSVWTVHDTTAPNVISVNITGLEVSNTYKARVRSIGVYSNSTYSNINYAYIPVNCTTPDTISVLSAVGSVDHIRLTWTDVTADSIYIYKGTSTNPSSYLTAVNNGVQAYNDSAVTQGTIYYYRLRAYENVCGLQGVYSATIFDTVKVTDTTPPSAPTFVDAINLNTTEAPPDTIGTLSAFTNVTNAERSGYYTAYSIVTVVDSCHAYCAGDSFKVGIYGAKDVIHRKVFNGDSIYVSLIASPLYSSTLSRTLTVSNTNSRTYSVSTLADPTVTNWYVDRDSPGGLNGTTFNGQSWSTAWREFNSSDYWGANPTGINWSVIGAGDTIFVSGGTDSTAYYSTSEGAYGINTRWSGNSNWSSGAQVVMCPAWHPLHNGTVYITDYGTSSPLLRILNVSNFKFTGFTIVDNRSGEVSGMVQIGGDDAGLTDSLIVFENNHIIGRGYTDGLYLNGTKTTVRNNIIENLQNSLPNDQDLLTISGGQGGHTIEGNTFIFRNDNDTTLAHRDMFQISNVGYNFTSGERQQITIANNFFIDTNPGGVGWNNMLYNYGWTGTVNARYVIYNNIFVNNKNETSVGALAIGRFYEGVYANHNSVYLFNNTFINNGTTGGMFTSWCLDTLVMKNNLWVKDNNAANFINPENSPELWASVVKDIDYNHYAELGGIDAVGNIFGANVGIGAGNTMSWDEWQTGLIDLNSTISNSTAVIFTNKYGETREDYYTTTGRDAGVDLSLQYPFLILDAIGNERTGDWDIGALEFGGVAVADTVPNTFSFTDITNAPLGQLHTSNAVTLAGFDSAWAYAGGASFTVYRFGAVQPYTYRTAPIKVYANDIVRVRQTSSTSYSTAVNAVLTIGGVADAYTVTTGAESAPSKLFRNAIYLTQSIGTHIYDHSQTGGAGVTNVPTELATYNTEKSYTGEYACTIDRDPVYPSDYPPTGNQLWHWADAFLDNGTHTFKEDYLDTDTYDIIMVKFCAAGQSAIWFWWYDGPQDTINYPQTESTYNYQWYVRKIVRVMESYPDKFFFLWNLPPATPAEGTADDMQRLADFNLWMTDTLQAGLDVQIGAFPSNIKIFDYFRLLVDPSTNYEHVQYRDATNDYHPNAAAGDYVAPFLVQQMFDAAIVYESTYNGGMNRIHWNRIAPFLKSNEINFWKGLQR